MFNSQAGQVSNSSFSICFDPGGQGENEKVADNQAVALWPPWGLCCVVVRCGKLSSYWMTLAFQKSFPIFLKFVLHPSRFPGEGIR